MGISLSRPGKTKARALLLAKQRNSVALRQRISLNRATLNNTLKQMGYPVPGQPRLSLRPRQRSSRQPPSTTLGRRQLGQTGPRVHTRINRRSRVPKRASKQSDKNKPLPPLPLLPPLPPPVRASTSRLEEELHRDYIERHREATLRRLESGRESPPLPPRSRVPSIILRRIKRNGMLWDDLVMGTPKS